MDLKTLNTRKKELLDQQELMLNKASEAKVQLTAAEEETFKNHVAEIDSINVNIARFEAIAKGRAQVGAPSSDVFIPQVKTKAAKTFSNCTPEYADAFWKALSTRNFTNAALAESTATSASDGSYLVPIQTDPSIPNLAIIEASARRLSRVMVIQMDLKLPYQSAKATAASKAETYTQSSTGFNAFQASVPTFNTTTLTAYMAGNQIPVSWELMQDVPALSAFVTAELNRAVAVYEENAFINGNGSGQPLGYLNGAVAQASAALSINTILDLVGALRAAYYGNAKFLFNRQEFHRLYKSQIATNQFQTFITYDANGAARLLGFPVEFSSQMPVYAASPSVSGAVLFGDFAAGWVIGDRGDSSIHVKVLDQVAAQQGQTVVLGYRRTDQRNTLQESVQCLTCTS